MTIPKTNDEVVAELEAKRDKREAEISKQEAEELKQRLSVRERLERKYQTDIVDVVMKDDIGEFTLRFKKLNPKQQTRLNTLITTDLTKLPPIERDQMNDELYHMIADSSLDGLSFGFFKDGTNYSTGDLVTIITKLAADSSLPDQKYINEILKFRSK